MKTKTSATLILLATFLLGGIAGALVYHLYARGVPAAGPSDGVRPGSHDFVEELARGLSLDVSQREQLKVIISGSREKYRALSRQMRPQFDAIRNQANQEIRQILHENQKARFEEILKDLEQRHRNRPDRSGPK